MNFVFHIPIELLFYISFIITQLWRYFRKINKIMKLDHQGLEYQVDTQYF